MNESYFHVSLFYEEQNCMVLFRERRLLTRKVADWPHVMTKDVFPLLVFCRIVVRFAVSFLKFLKHFLHLTIFKVFMHELCHWIKMVLWLHLLDLLFAGGSFERKKKEPWFQQLFETFSSCNVFLRKYAKWAWVLKLKKKIFLDRRCLFLWGWKDSAFSQKEPPSLCVVPRIKQNLYVLSLTLEIKKQFILYARKKSALLENSPTILANWSSRWRA